MTAPGHGPIDVDIAAMEPADFARVVVSRAVSGDPMAHAETHWDVATRYPRPADLVNVLAGLIDQLLGEVARMRNTTAAQLWQDLMLGEALEDR